MAAPLYPCVCPGHSKAVVEIFYCADVFISACLDRTAMLRDAATGDWIGSFASHKGALWSAKLNSDSTLAATGSADFSTKLWNALSGAELATLEHTHIVKSVDFSYDDARLATGSQDKKLRLFDVARVGASASATATAELLHPKGVRKVVWMPDGRRIVTGGDDGVVRIWDVASGAVALEMKANATGAAVMDLEWSGDDGRGGDGTLTVAASTGVLLLDARSLEVRRSLPCWYTVESASLQPGGRHLVAGGTDVWVHVHDADTGAEVATEKGHHGTVHCVRWAPGGGATFSSGADDATIRMWQLAAGGGSSGAPATDAAAAGGHPLAATAPPASGVAAAAAVR